MDVYTTWLDGKSALRYSAQTRFRMTALSEGSNVSSPDTDCLITLARQGDRSAQHQLLLRHRERLRRMVVSMLNPRLSARIDPSDVLQEAFAKAAQRLPDYLRAQPVAFYPWLRQIVKERLIDIHRRHIHAGRRSINKETRFDVYLSDTSAMLLADRLISRDPSPSAAANQQEMIGLVKTAMEKLSTEDRELLAMRFIEQLSVAEISQVLSVSRVTARSRLRQAIECLGRLVFHGSGSGT